MLPNSKFNLVLVARIQDTIVLLSSSCAPPTQGTAAGRGSAACSEFLEETYKAANAVDPAAERGRGDSEGEGSTRAKGNTSNGSKEGAREGEGGEFSDSELAGDDPLEGDRTSGEAEDSSDEDEEVKNARRDSETAHDAGSGDDDAGNSASAKGRAWVRRGIGNGSGSDAGNAAAPPVESSSSSSGRLVGFGVVGESETVELALQALAKVCACLLFVWFGLVVSVVGGAGGEEDVNKARGQAMCSSRASTPQTTSSSLKAGRSRSDLKRPTV